MTPMSDGGRLPVLIVDDDAAQRRVVSAFVTRAGWQPVQAASAAEALAALDAYEPRIAILDLMLPGTPGDELMMQLRERRPHLPVIILSAQDSVARAVEIMKRGPYEYMVKPVDPDHLVRVVERAVHERELEARVEILEREVQETYRFDQIVGAAPKMQRLYDLVDQVRETKITVFLSGESGTGKELVAKALHYHGSRRSGPFVALNCGAIPESLQESELFGHERGAFTGAVATHRGRFEQADRGTLFLDEVGELSPGAQTRLLRVLQESEIQRVGGTKTLPVDVRIISATHRDLEQLVREGTFREDLYYRLHVFPIELPPLRDRREDVPALVRHFARRFRTELGVEERDFDRDAMDVLCRYDWPGNVRELENVVQRALVSRRQGPIGVESLPPKLVMRTMGLAASVAAAASVPGQGVEPLEAIERRAIEHALLVLEGNVSLAAKQLGIGRATLYRKLAQYGMVKPD
jgi:DNA-binding NtrC family response regulator